MRYLMLISVCFAVWLSAVPVVAQPSGGNYEAEAVEARDLDKQRWEKLSRNLNYNQKPKEEKEKNSEAPELEGTENTPEPPSGISTPLSIFIGVVLLGIIAWLAYQLYNNRNRKLPPAAKDLALSLEAIAAELDQHEVKPYVTVAEEAGEFSLAMRFLFLAALKELHESGQVVWKKDYTNRQYLQQLRGKPPHDAFRELVRIYERNWYGGRLLQAADYWPIKALFVRFEQQFSTQNAPA